MIPLNHLIITKHKKSYLFFILEIILKQLNSSSYSNFKDITNLFFDKIINILKMDVSYFDNEKIKNLVKKQLLEKVKLKDYTIKENKYIDNKTFLNINTKELLELGANDKAFGVRKRTKQLIIDYEKLYNFIID